MRTNAILASLVISILAVTPQTGCVEADLADGEQALDEPPDGRAPWKASFHYTQAAGVSQVCWQLGGFWTSATSRCITRGFRIGRTTQLSEPQCEAYGGEWANGYC